MTSLAKIEQGAVVSAARQESNQFLIFTLGGESFAIGILSIKEIIEYGGLTTVPMVPGFIRGVINLRGAVVPVVDLMVRFGKPSQEASKRTCIVIIEVEYEGEKHDIGVVVDAVNEVLEIPSAEIEPPPAFGSRIRVDFISGMGKVAEHFVIILDVNRVLSVEDMSMLAAVGDRRPGLPDELHEAGTQH